MDILGMLEDRLGFIGRFYAVAAEPFETAKQKIEAEEEPFVPQYEPGDYDGPAYESEWQEADHSVRVLGQCCLSLVQKALHDYLREFIVREAGVRRDELGSVLKPYKGDGWFERYRAFLEERTQFNWAACPVARERIEQINLCRNDLTHEPGIP